MYVSRRKLSTPGVMHQPQADQRISGRSPRKTPHRRKARLHHRTWTTCDVADLSSSTTTFDIGDPPQRMTAAETTSAREASAFPMANYAPDEPLLMADDTSGAAGGATTTEPSTACQLNVGGKLFRVRLKAVHKRLGDDGKTSFLARFVNADHRARLSQCDEYWPLSDAYYFERSPRLFEPVFDWLTSGTLHKPTDVCAQQFVDELAFWQIGTGHIACCCAPQCSNSHIMHQKNQRLSIASHGSGRMQLANGRRRSHYTYDNDGSPSADPMLYSDKRPNDNCDAAHVDDDDDDDDYADEFTGVCCGRLRASLWDLTEDPSTSKAAKIFAVLSIGFVLLSVLGLILGSIPELQVVGHQFENENGKMKDEMVPHPILQYAEYCCIGWFTMEYLLRLAICTRKWAFCKETLNLIDFITIAPFYLELLLSIFGFDVNKISNIKGAVLVMRIVRVLRVARVFKLARYSTGLKSFGTTVQNSVQELSMLFLFLITAIIFFSTIVYFLEKDEEKTHFQSIPDAMWWCIVTMTTVGYGDSVPITALGKIVASFASISGVLVLAFPITMIVENFSKSYDSTKQTEGAGPLDPAVSTPGPAGGPGPGGPPPGRGRRHRRRSTVAGSQYNMTHHKTSRAEPNHLV